jgi:hypothetical protein
MRITARCKERKNLVGSKIFPGPKRRITARSEERELSWAEK